MKFAAQHKTFLVNAYIYEDKSTYQIAEELNTYPNKVRRALKFLGIQLKSKSEAQSTALKQGRHKHPTKGKQRTQSDKINISEGMSKYWHDMGDDERQRRVDMAKKQWYAMSDEERYHMRKAAIEAVRRAGKEGSRMEKFLYKGLMDEGFEVSFHQKNLIPNANLEIDLFVPGLKTAIEVDGPAHFFPIWGEANLQRHVKSDAHKSGLLLNRGFVLLRIKHLTRNISAKLQRDALKLVLTQLNKIRNEFPPVGKRYLELEI